MLAPPPGRARVFLRTGGEALHGATAGGQPGWTRILNARFRINGGAGHLEALGCSMPQANALLALQATYRDRKGTAHVFPGGKMGWGFARVENRVIRFLAVEVARPGECVVFRIEQTLEEFRDSMKPPPEPKLIALPPPEPGRVTLFAVNETTRTEFEIMESDRPVAAIERILKEQIQSAGWQDALPREATGGLHLVVRNHDVGLWMVHESPDGRAQIVRILKRGAAP